MADDKRTVVEEGSEFEGTLRSSRAVVVRGSVAGELAAPSVDVEATGRLTGKATVGRIVSRGEIGGVFDAQSVELAGKVANGTVLTAKELSVKPSASGTPGVVFGECTLHVGDEPVRG